MGRIRSGVRVSASFQIFALRMLLYTPRGTSGKIFSRGNIRGMSAGGGLSSAAWHQMFLITFPNNRSPRLAELCDRSSVILSFALPVSRITRTSTKHGRHVQGVTL